MKFKFSDIYEGSLYDTARAVIVTGQYDIFSNLVVDRLKSICKEDVEYTDVSYELEGEFLDGARNKSEENYMSFDEFMDVVSVPSMVGKWYCSIDYKMLTKRQRDKLKRYLRNPSDNGVLVIISKDYVDYKEFLKNNIIKAHKNSHLIQLQFPDRITLKKILGEMLEHRGVKLPIKAVELFIMRMGNNYEEYGDTLDIVCKGRENTALTYKEFSESMKGVENYVIDDFIEYLLRGVKSKKVVVTRKIYRILDGLIQDIGPKSTVFKVRFKVEDLIAMRIFINDGIIPIGVKFSVAEAKGRIGEGNKLYNINDYAFRRLVELASVTSLRDLLYIKMILGNINNNWNEEEYERVLHSVIHRAIFSSNRLINNIGLDSVLDSQLYDINTALLVRKE